MTTKILIDPDELLNAWLAGFFDGEGSISLFRIPGRVTCALKINLSQKNWVVLDEVRKRFGGKVRRQTAGAFVLELSSVSTMKAFLSAIQSHVVLKHVEVQYALAILNLMGTQGQHSSDENTLVRVTLEERLREAARSRREDFCEDFNEQV